MTLPHSKSRRRALSALARAVSVTLTLATPMQTIAAGPEGNPSDLALRGVFEARERDWRNGAVVYQVLVDRFAPSARLEHKRDLYPAPKRLRRWDEVPRAGQYLSDQRLWSHEIDFWGGDLRSVAARLDHVRALGADVLYLNPIHHAYTNHKYDALDYLSISPEFGARDDLKALAADVHRRGMRLVLDGVFNHMGRNAPVFRRAESDPGSPERQWFDFGPQYPGGARTWWNAENLPELNLENPAVRAHIYGTPDSVVRSYLRDGIDGWRLDVAFDIGFAFLDELTRAAHAEKPGSLVVGEIANYPRDWFPAVDGIMHFTLRHLMLRTAAARLEPAHAARLIGQLVGDVGIEPMLKSWLYLDNHDTPRLATALPDVRQRRLAQVLQFTLPGSPNLYYGSELGMTGGDDPEMRAPMRWDVVRDDQPDLAYTRRLVALHQHHRALKVGNFRLLQAQHLIAFERSTDRAADTVLVLLNTSDAPVRETLLWPNSKVMDGTRLRDLLGGPEPIAERVMSALLEVTVPARSAMLLAPVTTPVGGYNNYKRVQ